MTNITTKMITKSKIIGTFIGVFMLLSNVYAQNALLNTGNHHFESFCYIKAIEAYEQALTKKGLAENDKMNAKLKLAYSYRQIRDTQSAERSYREVVESGMDLCSSGNGTALLQYAQALASNGKYRESQEVYDKYTRCQSDDSRGKAFSQLYNDVSKLSKNANCFKVDYVNINSGKADFSPTYYKNGVVFVSGRGEGGAIRRVFNWNETAFLDLFYLEDMGSLNSGSAGLGGGSTGTSGKQRKVGTVGSDEYTAPTANDSRTIGSFGSGVNAMSGLGYDDKPLTESERFSKTINTKYHEGPSVFFKDGSKVIFTRNNFLNGKYRKSSDGINKLKLYTADASGTSWKNVQDLPFNSDEYSTGHPALSPDEKLLFFVSDMPGGFGGTDIYVSRIDGNGWSAPVNLGKEVNSKGNEMFPYLDTKGNLYFSSDGHAGLGDLDIFVVRTNGAIATGKPKNLGSPINSSKDDFGILTDGELKTGYFSSNRKRGGADDDIYTFTRDCPLQECRELLISVYDAESKMPLDNTKVVFEDKDGKLQEKITDADGGLKLCLEGENEFTFRATRDGYLPNTVGFSTKGLSDDEPSRLEIPLNKQKNDTTATANNHSPQNFPNSSTPTNSGNSSYTDSGSGTTSSSSSSTSTEFIPGQTGMLRGRALTQKGRNVIEGANITLRNECDGTTQTAYTSADGSYQFVIKCGCDYMLEGQKDGFGTRGAKIRKITCGRMPEFVTADLLMFEQGDVIEIENIYYDYGKCNIRSDAQTELDKLVRLMRKYPNMRIELRSHTDSRSDTEFNQTLSDGRAKEAAKYLVKHGVRADRIEAAGYGESLPVNGCVDGVECSEEQHQQNRRTEIKILQLK